MTEHSSEPVAWLSGISFRYPHAAQALPILEDVSLSVPMGDFLGVIGPNGGGKTTLMKVLLGLLKPNSGTVRVLGRAPHEVSRHVGYVPQALHIDGHVPATVLDVVLTGRIGLSSWGFRYGRDHIEKARDAMDRVEVGDLSERNIMALSGGQFQRVLIARALAADAKLLLLDEPMAGVDAHMEHGILDLLHRLNEHLTIVLVSHDLGFISTHVKRVACLNRRMVVHCPCELTQEMMDEMYGSHGPVQQLYHRQSCPFDMKRGEADAEGKER